LWKNRSKLGYPARKALSLRHFPTGEVLEGPSDTRFRAVMTENTV
jgi:hypothetical protein